MQHSQLAGGPARPILIVTDAWRPQINGVVRTLESVGKVLAKAGSSVAFLTPERFWTLPVPSYPEIRISLASVGAVSRQIEAVAPDHIHIATEGPLGLLARQYCLNQSLSFTTSFHTRFPEYVAMRVPVPQEWSYGYLRWFHGAAVRTLVPTPSLRDDLIARGFRNFALWSRGVDANRFRPGPKTWFTDLPGPHLLYVGRVAAEKNVEAFLQLDLPGTKIVAGMCRTGLNCSEAIPKQCSWVTGMARSSGRFTAVPTCSFFPAAPTPLAMSSPKRWPREHPLQPIR